MNLKALLSAIFLLGSLSSDILGARAGTVVAVGAATDPITIAPGETPNISPVILKYDGTVWQQVPASPATGLELYGVTFSSPQTAWSFGAWADGRPALIRSRDGGDTWEDMHPVLPQPMNVAHRVFSAAFADDATGWIASRLRNMPFGPYVASTQDGGASWHLVDTSPLQLLTFARLEVRSGDLTLFRVDPSGRALKSLVAVSSSGDSFEKTEFESATFEPRAIAGAGEREWIVGESGRPGKFFGKVVDIPARPRIFSRTGASAWVEQPLPFEGPGILRHVHFRDVQAGLAGGKRLGTPSWPLILYTNDGETWSEGEVPPELEDFYVSTLLRASGESGWAVVKKEGGVGIGFALLETSDGGASWQRVPTAFDDVGMLRAIAEGPEP